MRTAVCHMVEAVDLARERGLTCCNASLDASPAARWQPRPVGTSTASPRTCPRKNGWTLAEHAGDHTPDKMQRLLNHAVWDHQQAQQVYASSSSSTSPTRMRYWCSTSPARRKPAPTR